MSCYVTEPYILLRWEKRGAETIAICSQWKGGSGSQLWRMPEEKIVTLAQCKKKIDYCIYFEIECPHLHYMVKNWGVKQAFIERERRVTNPKFLPRGFSKKKVQA